MPDFTLIPDPRRDCVRDALQSAFGHGRARDLHPIQGGVSGALILRFELDDRPLVLRLEPERIAIGDRERGYACMAAAALAGVAPRVHFADPTTGVAIMDFIDGRPLSDHPGGPVGLVKGLGQLIAGLQAAPRFPTWGDYPDAIGELLTSLKASPLLPPGELDPMLETLAALRMALPWRSEALVACHNDPNPRNLIFDGERLWLVDWELASSNDPLVDVAILTTEFAETPELEGLLVQSAFGVWPDEPLRARLHLIRLLTRLFYGGIVIDSLAGAVLDPWLDDAPLTADAFRASVADGRLPSGTPRTAYAFARMSLRAFRHGADDPAFARALDIVRHG